MTSVFWRPLLIGSVAAMLVGAISALVVMQLRAPTCPSCPTCAVCPPTPSTPAITTTPPVPAVPPVAAPPRCESYEHEEGVPPAEWTIGEDHFGPITRCSVIDQVFLERVLPGFAVEQVAHGQLGGVFDYVVTQAGHRLMTISPAIPNGGPRLTVAIHTRSLETPWRVRVGDSLRKLRAHHRDVQCAYGAAEGSEGVWCRRTSRGDGWIDGFTYALDLRPLGRDRSLFEREEFIDKIGFLVISTISWQTPGSP